jgi:uncharacterized protein with PQ loop repeat
MKKVDYLKLSEQYASFLVAIGGVSITALTLVLSLGSEPTTLTEGDTLSFLVAALVVATALCFIGAHMMSETAAFISCSKEPVSDKFNRKASGERLFLLASINIFVAIILVLFALMLLPTASGRVDPASIKPISFTVFGLIVFGAFCWMILASNYRMPVPHSGRAIVLPLIIGLVLGLILYFLLISKRYLLWATFIPIVIFTVASLLYFAWIFKDGSKARLRKARIRDIYFFSSAITISYASLVVASIRTMLDK